MQRARAGDPARKDLPALRDELLQRLDVLVVDVLELLHAELAHALAAIEELLLTALLSARSAAAAEVAAAGMPSAASAAATRSSHFSCHDLISCSLFSRSRFIGFRHVRGVHRTRNRCRTAGREGG